MLPRPSEHGEATLYHKRDPRLLRLSSHLRTVLENEELAMRWDHVGCVHIWSSAFISSLDLEVSMALEALRAEARRDPRRDSYSQYRNVAVVTQVCRRKLASLLI
jgi:hypothetical protein